MGNVALRMVPPIADDGIEAVAKDGVTKEDRKRQHAAELAQMALEAGDTEWASTLLQDSRDTSGGGPRKRLVRALAPWVGGIAALTLTLVRCDEPWTDVEHHARVAFMLASPWLTKFAAELLT